MCCLKYFGRTHLGFGMVPTAIGMLYFAEMGLVYVVASLNGQWNITLPYITSAADQRPTSCLFSLCSNLISLLLFVMVFVRHRQCQAFYTVDVFWGVGHLNVREMILWNNVSKWCGNVGALGWFIIANIQESAFFYIHSIGAHAAYGGILLYMIFQVWFACDISREEQRKSPYYFRFFLTIITCAFFVSFITFEIKHIYAIRDVITFTTNDVLGFEYNPFSDSNATAQNYHLASVIAEWACVFCEMVFIMSYYSELEKVQMVYRLEMMYADLDAIRRVRDQYNMARGRYQI